MEHPACQQCGGRTEHCYSGIPHNTNVAPEIIVVTEQPDFAFGSNDFISLSRYLSQFIDLNKVYWTGAVKCWGKTPKKAVKHCKEFITYEVEQYKPKLLITVGGNVIRWLYNKAGSKEDIRVRQRTFGSHTLTHLHLHNVEAVEKTPYNGIINQWTLSKVPDILAGKYPRQVLNGKNYTYHDISNIQQFIDYITNYLPDGHLISLDIETGGKDENGLSIGNDPWHPNYYIIGIGISWAEGQAAYLRCTSLPIETIKSVLELLRPFQITCQNGKFDILTSIKVKYEIDLEDNLIFDTMLVDHLIREWDRRHSLKFISALRMPEFDGYDDPVDTWFESKRIAKDKRDYGDLPPELLEPYCCADADVTRRLTYILQQEFKDQSLTDAMIPHVLKMQAAYAEAEVNGWGVDSQYWQEIHSKIIKEQQDELAILQSHQVWIRWVYHAEAKLRAEGKVFYDKEHDKLYTDVSKQTEVSGHRHKKGNVIKAHVYTIDDVTPKPSNDNFKRTILFGSDWFGLTPYKLTDKKKDPSVDSDSLREVAMNVRDESQNAFIQALLGYERREKLLTTYIRPVFQTWTGEDKKPKKPWIHADGLIHPGYYLAGNDWSSSFDEGGTNSGRISGKNPNMTNIPTRQGGKRIKKQFIAMPRWFDGKRYEVSWLDVPEEWVIIQADYSQLELRVLADLSSDPFMLTAYQNNEDLHTKLSTQQWHQTLEWFEERLNNEQHPECDKANDMRLCSKTSWFSVVYGAGGAKLHQTLLKYGIRDVSEDKAKVMIVDLKNTIPVAVQWLNRILAQAPVITTPFGRRRHAIDYYSTEEYLRRKAERQLGNFIIQSTGSDIFSMGFYRLREWLKNERAQQHTRAYPMGTVHDSVILACPMTEIDYVCFHAKRIMENLPLPWQPKLEFKVDIEFGSNWGELQKWRYAG